MRTVPIVVAILMSAVARFGLVEVQAGQYAPAAVASQAAKKAWFARAIGDILSASIEPNTRDTAEQGRSVSRIERR